MVESPGIIGGWQRGTYGVVVAFVFDLGVFGGQALHDFGELDSCVAVFIGLLTVREGGVDVLSDVVLDIISGYDLFPKRLVIHLSSGPIGPLCLLFWHSNAQAGYVVQKNLLGVLEIGLDAAEAVDGEVDALGLHADHVEAGDEAGVLEANGVFGLADCLVEFIEFRSLVSCCYGQGSLRTHDSVGQAW